MHLPKKAAARYIPPQLATKLARSRLAKKNELAISREIQKSELAIFGQNDRRKYHAAVEKRKFLDIILGVGCANLPRERRGAHRAPRSDFLRHFASENRKDFRSPCKKTPKKPASELAPGLAPGRVWGRPLPSYIGIQSGAM